MLALVFGLTLWAMTGTARAQIFVVIGGNFHSSVGEYTMSGSTVNAALINISTSNEVQGLSVSGSDIFTTDDDFGTIGEYTTSGSTVNASLITGQGASSSITVSGSDTFFSNHYTSSIEKYTTSGSQISGALVSIANDSETDFVAVSGSYIYSVDDTFSQVQKYTVAGSTVNTSLLSMRQNRLSSIAVSGSYVFVIEAGDSGATVGEYTSTGGTVNASLITGLSNPAGIAVSGSDIFVTNLSVGGSIGEYTTTGGTVNASLVTGLNDPYGIAVIGSAGAPVAITPTSRTTTVLQGSGYNTAPPLTSSGGFGTTATIAGGIASGSCQVTMAFKGIGNYANIASDVVTISGMPNNGAGTSGQTLTDTFVLKLTYDNN